MNSTIVAVGSSFIFSGIFTPLATFIAKTFIEKHIEAKYRKELEGWKAGYQQVLNENQVRFTRIHEEQVVAIKKTYQYISSISKIVNTYNQDFKRILEDESSRVKMAQLSHDLDVYYHENQLLFPDLISNNILSFILLCSEISRTQTSVLGTDYDKKLKYDVDFRRKTLDDFCKQASDLRFELTILFRNILGVKSYNNTGD